MGVASGFRVCHVAAKTDDLVTSGSASDVVVDDAAMFLAAARHVVFPFIIIVMTSTAYPESNSLQD